MSDIEIIKNYGSIENYIYELEQKNKELKEGNTIYNQFVNYKNWYFDYVDKYENLQQENKQLKSIVKERELEIITLILELLRIAKQDYYWITNDKFEEAKKKIIHFVVTGDNDKKYFIEELDKANGSDSNE